MRGQGECPIFPIKRKKADGTEYTIFGFDLVLQDGTKKRFTSKVGEKKGDFVKKKNAIMIEYQKAPKVKASFCSVEVFLTGWLAQKRDLSDSTKTVYTNYLTCYILPIIGDITLQKLTTADIDSLISHLLLVGGEKTNKDGTKKQLRPLSPASLRKVKFMLRQAFDFAIDRELISSNPAQKITLPKVQKPAIQPFTTEEITKILDAAKETNMHIGILLALSTGLRRGELLGLRWGDIDLKTGLCTINRQLLSIDGKPVMSESLKTADSVRQVVIPDKVLTLLELEKASQEAEQESRKDETDPKKKYQNADINYDLIVRQKSGKHFHPRNFAKNFEKILVKAGVDNRKVYNLRHTFATQLLSSGAYVSEVQAALGHKDAKTTLQNYSHILPGRQKEVAAKMNNLLPV